MRKITKEEFESTYTGSQNLLLKEILNLKLDEAIEVSFAEWKHNYTPQSPLYNLAKKRGMKFESKTDKEKRVWLFLRVL